MISERFDIQKIRSNCIKDETTGLTFVPFTGRPEQYHRAYVHLLDLRINEYLFIGGPPTTRLDVDVNLYRELVSQNSVKYELFIDPKTFVGHAGLHSIVASGDERFVSTAISIDIAYQRQGLALRSQLMALTYAKYLGFTTMYSTVHWDNVPSIDLFRRFASQCDKHDGSSPYVDFTIPLREFTPPDDVRLVAKPIV